MRWQVFTILGLLLIPPVFAVCGDLICTPDEIGSCRDCATINSNNVCDSFSGALTQYDPDCKSTSCYDKVYIYSNGKGDSCYPGYCQSGGCDTLCVSDSDCGSNFCNVVCKSTCESNCTTESSNYKVYPISSTIFLGDPTFVSFNIIRTSGSSSPSLSVQSPCNTTYDSSIDLSTGEGVAVVKITNCDFIGAGSVKLSVGGEAWNVAHILSYPALLYTQGEMPDGVVGHSAMANSLGGVPLEVELWYG